MSQADLTAEDRYHCLQAANTIMARKMGELIEIEMLPFLAQSDIEIGECIDIIAATMETTFMAAKDRIEIEQKKRKAGLRD